MPDVERAVAPVGIAVQAAREYRVLPAVQVAVAAAQVTVPAAAQAIARAVVAGAAVQAVAEVARADDIVQYTI